MRRTKEEKREGRRRIHNTKIVKKYILGHAILLYSYYCDFRVEKIGWLSFLPMILQDVVWYTNLLL